MESMPEQPVESPVYDAELAQRVKLSIADSYDSEGGAAGAIKEIQKRLTGFAELLIISPEELAAEFATCASLENKDDFVAAVFKILEPLLIVKKNYPKRWDVVARREFQQREDFMVINQLLAYGIDGDTIYLHVAPNETTPAVEKVNLIKSGLKELAVIVKNSPDIKYIVGISWIVASRGSLLERLGFTVRQLTDEEKGESHDIDLRDTALASISREELLQRYGS
ncbi:MAG: hypothetical protein V1846_04650 [Candidatus Komeilibacteria bacterium]